MRLFDLLNRRPALTALLIGAASAFAFQPVGLEALMPLALAILCALLSWAPTLKRALLIGWCFGLGQFGIGLNWIATAFTFQAAMPAWFGWAAVVLVALYLAIYPMLAAGIAWRFGRDRPLALILALAGAWAITEWLRATLFTGFAWNPLGASDLSLSIGLVPLIGTYGASAFLVLIGGSWWLLTRWDVRSFVGLVIIAMGASILSASLFDGPGSTRTTAIRVVQPNIGQQDKWRPGFSEEAARRLAEFSAQSGTAHPQLLFWPEAAVTDPLEDARSDEHQAFANFERTRAAALLGPGDHLLTGGIALDSRDGFNVTGAANSVFVLGQGGKIAGRYDKAHLVPFGEYLPVRPLLSAIGLSRLAPGDVDFAAGPGPRTATLAGVGRVGFQLCYEIIFSGEVIDRRNRPDFIFNPSNDAWFGRWGPPQHLVQARLRAAEEGVPVIRSTPTGISAVIDAQGHVVESLPWRTAGVIDTTLPSARAPTLFARGGNLIPLLLGFALIIAAIALSAPHRYRRGT